MSISAKRRETEVFSLAFLDCICCGFGAVILVFILTVTQKSDVDKADVDAAREKLRAAQRSVSLTQEELDRGKWVKASMDLILEKVRRCTDIEDFARDILAELAPLINSGAALMFIEEGELRDRD